MKEFTYQIDALKAAKELAYSLREDVYIYKDAKTYYVSSILCGNYIFVAKYFTFDNTVALYESESWV